MKEKIKELFLLLSALAGVLALVFLFVRGVLSIKNNDLDSRLSSLESRQEALEKEVRDKFRVSGGYDLEAIKGIRK